MAIYESAEQYIDCDTDLLGRISRLQSVIVGLETMMIKAAETGNYEEYSLDDGQTKIRTKYRDISAIAASIASFDLIRQKLISRLNNKKNGRVVRLVDSKNFRR